MMLVLEKKKVRVTVYCTCPSGRFKGSCKHKFTLLLEKEQYLHPDEDFEILKKVKEFIENYDLFDILMKYRIARNKVQETEQELKEVEKQLNLAVTPK